MPESPRPVDRSFGNASTRSGRPRSRVLSDARKPAWVVALVLALALAVLGSSASGIDAPTSSVGSVPESSAIAPSSGTPRDASSAGGVAAPTNYTLSKQFVPARGNQQGLGFQGGTFYLGYDSGNGNGRIRSYSATGSLLADTGLIRIGHAAELDWRSADSKLYVANGGRTNPTHVYKVNATSGVIERDYNFASLGNNGMVAIDDTAGNMKLFYGPVAPDNNYRIGTVDFSGALAAQFVVKKKLGVPQGIDVAGDQILYLYSKPWGDGSGNHNNWIAVYSQTGTVLGTIPLPSLIDEGQGLAIDSGTNTVYIGAKGPNAVYKLEPAFVPF